MQTHDLTPVGSVLQCRGRKSRLKRQLSQAFPRGRVDCIGERGRGHGRTRFADSTGRLAVPYQTYVDRRRLIHSQDAVVAEVGLLDPTIVERDFAPQRAADAVHDPALDRLYAKVASERGKIDILFAGAGIVDPQPLAETTEESFDKVFAINTRGLAFTVKKALPLLNDGGAIIVITSIAENKGIPGFTAYSATKAAVRSFVRTWTAELKDRRIRVNAISPGPIDTPIFDQQAPTKEGADQARAQFAAAVPFGRLGRPEEIASTALFLASDEASFIAGVDLPVDGGMTAI